MVSTPALDAWLEETFGVRLSAFPEGEVPPAPEPGRPSGPAPWPAGEYGGPPGAPPPADVPAGVIDGDDPDGRAAAARDMEKGGGGTIPPDLNQNNDVEYGMLPIAAGEVLSALSFGQAVGANTGAFVVSSDSVTYPANYKIAGESKEAANTAAVFTSSGIMTNVTTVLGVYGIVGRHPNGHPFMVNLHLDVQSSDTYDYSAFNFAAKAAPTPIMVGKNPTVVFNCICDFNPVGPGYCQVGFDLQVWVDKQSRLRCLATNTKVRQPKVKKLSGGPFLFCEL